MKKLLILLGAAALLLACSPQKKLTVSGLNPKDFKGTYNGMPTALYTMTNANGMEVCVTNFGGRIVSIMVPDKDGKMQDVVLGFDKVSDYFPENNHLDGVEYQLPQNNFGHCLHGGPTGWQYQVYECVEADAKHVKLLRVSPDGDNNFPGEVKAYVTYTLTDDNKLDIAYEATTTAPTVINMTNHSYFNLSGDPNRSIVQDVICVNADYYTPVDSTYMTTGEIAPVKNTPFDFTTPTLILSYIDAKHEQIKNGNGYDHNWVLNTKGDISKLAGLLYSPASGITMMFYTDEPGIQVYSGNFLDGTVTGKKGITYQQRAAICLETQKYPDSPNKPDWPSAVLRPGETYHSHTIYAFSTRK